MGWMQATTSISVGEEGEEFFLDIPSDRTSPLIGLIEQSGQMMDLLGSGPVKRLESLLSGKFPPEKGQG
jgi:hypothetical protein